MSAGPRLARALQASAREAGCAIRIATADERRWASATFTGAQHEIVVDAAPSARLSAWLDALHGLPLALPGHVVAQLAVERGAAGTRVTALTLEI